MRCNLCGYDKCGASCRASQAGPLFNQYGGLLNFKIPKQYTDQSEEIKTLKAQNKKYREALAVVIAISTNDSLVRRAKEALKD